MASLTFEIKGNLGAITLNAFQTAVNCALRILADYDLAISGEKAGSLDWFITGISAGSLVIQATSRSKLAEKNFGPKVTEFFVRGWAQIEEAGLTPPLLSERGMLTARKLTRLIGKEGVTGFRVSIPDKAVEITSKSSTHLEPLTRVVQHSIGSVEGRLMTISIRGRSRIILYHSRTGKAVTCSIPEAELPRLITTDMLGLRVIAYGRVSSNVLGEPMRVDVEHVRPLRREEDLPDIADLSGKFPDLTGDLSTEEYLRSLRGE